MNKNSNKYTIIYTIVMVVIVGALLAILATALKPRQEENVLNEQKTSIMKAFGDEDGDFNDVKVYLLDKNGSIEEQKGSDIEKVFKTISNRKDLAELENDLPFFEYTRKTKDGEETLTVVPIGCPHPVLARKLAQTSV